MHVETWCDSAGLLSTSVVCRRTIAQADAAGEDHEARGFPTAQLGCLGAIPFFHSGRRESSQSCHQNGLFCVRTLVLPWP